MRMRMRTAITGIMQMTRMGMVMVLMVAMMAIVVMGRTMVVLWVLMRN